MKIALAAEGAFFEERALAVELHWGRGGGERVVADVADDAAESSPALKAALESGFVVVVAGGEPKYEAMTVAQLKADLAAYGVEIPAKATKPKLVALLEAAAAELVAESPDLQGGTNVPADDSDALSSDEAGAPPSDDSTTE